MLGLCGIARPSESPAGSKRCDRTHDARETVPKPCACFGLLALCQHIWGHVRVCCSSMRGERRMCEASRGDCGTALKEQTVDEIARLLKHHLTLHPCSYTPTVLSSYCHHARHIPSSSTSRQITQLLYDRKLRLRFIRQRCVARAIHDHGVNVRLSRSFGLC